MDFQQATMGNRLEQVVVAIKQIVRHVESVNAKSVTKRALSLDHTGC